MAARRGWRERVEPGLYRAHRTACPSTADHRTGRRCSCGYEIKVPGGRPGTTRTITITGSVGEARAERRRLLAAGRPAGAAPVVEVGTLDGFAAAYFRARAPSLAANTVRNREDDYRRRISPGLGGLTLEEVTREAVEAWLAQLVATASSRRMVVQTVATLRVILATAVEWGRMGDNPARRLRLPRPDPTIQAAAERVVGADQLDALFTAAGGPRTESLLRAAGEAGMRRAELAGLRWGDVNLAAARLEVRRQVVQERLPNGGHRKLVTVPKAGRTRRVAMSAGLTAALTRWYEESVVTGGADATGYIWPGNDGGPMHDRTVARALERACRRIGLGEWYTATTKKGPQQRFRAYLSPHRLRHSCASVMIREGVPLTVVAAQLGHADPAITARIYSHLIDDRDLDLAAAAFNRPNATGTVGGTVGEDTPTAENPIG